MPTVKVRPVPIYRKQADFLQASEWLTGFCGGRGTGKTWIGAYRVQRQAKSKEPWMGVSPDAGVVHETTFPTFLEVAKKTGVLVREKLSPYPRIWWRTHDGGIADIVFRSSEVPSKLRGPSKAGLWIDEASVCSKDTFDIAIATLRHEGSMGPCLLTFTPKGRAHWTFDSFFDPVDEYAVGGNDGATTDGIEWIQGRPYRHKENSRLIRAHTLDNPFLPEQFAEILRGRYTQTLAEQELAGEFVDISGLMFSRPWFLPVEHAPRDARRVRYWDRASTPGDGCYSAGVLIAMDNRGLVYVEDVVRGQWSALDRNQVMEQTAQRDAYKYDGEVMIYTEQEGGSGGKEVSQQIVRMLAGHPVFIDNVGGQRSRTFEGQKLPGEAKVIRAMGFAAQAEAGNVRMVRAPWNSDYLDELCLCAGTHILTGRGEVPIESVAVGDVAWTRQGWRKVVVSRKTSDRARLWEIKSQSGRSILGTEGHPVWLSAKGFTKIGHVQAGDELLSFAGDTDSISTPKRHLTQSERTSPDTLTGKTSNFIAGLLERLAKGITFTTKTETRETTGLKISSSCLHPTTCGTTSKAETFREARKPYLGNALFAATVIERLLPLPGLRHAESGVAVACRPSEETTSSTAASVSTAERTTARRSARGGSALCSVPESISAPADDSPKRSVPSATPLSSPSRQARNVVPDPVVSVSDTGTEGPVYNIEVEGEHEYFANGILTHNCAFPEITNADQVDATSGAYNMLAKGIAREAPPASKSRVQADVTKRFGAGLALERARQRRVNDR